MLSRFFMLFRLGRILLVLLAAHALVAAPALTASAVAIADDDDDDWEDDEEEEDEEEEDEDEEDEDEEDEEDGSQPPVTAGGMFTKKTYPIAELERPLTITKGILEVRGGIDIDVSAETAFETWRFKLDGRYGLQDHVELQAAFATLLTGDAGLGTAGTLFSAGIEGGIVYDLVHFRALVELPLLTVVDDAAAGTTKTEAKFDLAFGFPFRYKPKPKVAIIALDKLMTIHTDDRKPDLTVGVGIVYQLLPNLAALLRGEVFVPEFNTDNVQIPATAAIQFTPSNKLDIGGEFTLGDVKNDDDPFANRSLLLFAQARF